MLHDANAFGSAAWGLQGALQQAYGGGIAQAQHQVLPTPLHAFKQPGVFKCQAQPVERALAHGLYGSWEPTAVEIGHLKAIFPTGVCDYSKSDLGLPPELSGSSQGAKK